MVREHWLARSFRAAMTLGRLAELVDVERSFRGGASLRRRMRWWRHGFLSQSGMLYEPFDPKGGEYLSDFARYVQTIKINGTYIRLLDSKLAFTYMMEALRPGTVPRLVGTVFEGELNLVGNGSGGTDPIAGVLEREGNLVIKPVEGSLGTGFRLVSRAPGGALSINRQRASRAELDQLVRGCEADILTEFIHQADYSNAIYPGATNTVRVLTLRCPVSGDIYVPAAVHRFGTDRSAPVDAWHKGGISASIDLDSGVMNKAIAIPPDAGWQTHHPDTGTPIQGALVPRWRAVLDGVVGLARQLPFLPYIGWDVVVTDDGFRVLEANGRTAIDLYQVHAPLLRDDRVRRFYEHYGVRAR